MDVFARRTQCGMMHLHLSYTVHTLGRSGRLRQMEQDSSLRVEYSENAINYRDDGAVLVDA